MSPSAFAAQLSPLKFFEADLPMRSYRSSIRSNASSDRLNYFTPTSSILMEVGKIAIATLLVVRSLVIHFYH